MDLYAKWRESLCLCKIPMPTNGKFEEVFLGYELTDFRTKASMDLMVMRQIRDNPDREKQENMPEITDKNRKKPKVKNMKDL